MKKLFAVTVLLFVIFLHNPALAINRTDKKDAKAFFKQYIALSDNFDLSVATLYSDRAKIRAYRRTAEGTELIMEISGVKWKELVVKVMPLAKETGDISKFSRIRYSSDGEKIKIKANRYSTLKCYTDKGYYMILERDENNEFKIIEEYAETRAESNCKGAKKDVDLPTLLKKTRDQTKVLLPMMLDDDTRLDDVEIGENLFQYHYTLVNYALEDLDTDLIGTSLLPIVKNQACTLPILKKMMDKGATISFSYKGKNGKKVVTMDVVGGDCK